MPNLNLSPFEIIILLDVSNVILSTDEQYSRGDIGSDMHPHKPLRNPSAYRHALNKVIQKYLFHTLIEPESN